MNYTASYRYARISPRKVRYVVDLVRGKAVNQAVEILKLSPRRSAVMALKVLNSAIANASQDAKIDVNTLVVAKVYVDGGPIIKRYRPGPMGRSMKIRKRTCHIHFILSGQEVAAKKSQKEQKEQKEQEE